MKTNNRDCIKLLSFLFCAVLALGCNKNDVGETKEEFVDDSPVAIRLSAGDPSYVMTTKAAVEEWSNSVLNVFGMKRGRGTAVGDGVYDFNDKVTNIVDYETAAASGEFAELEIFSDKENRIPFYYTDGYVYDFYGYHLGGATAAARPVSGDVYSYDVEFDGSNDLMYATTDKGEDIRESENAAAASATEAEVYSSWAARRGIHPTLKFEHALARLNFIVQGKGNKFQDVIITGVSVKSVNTGVLTVVGPEMGFEPAEGVAMATLSLKGVGDAVVDKNDSKAPLGGPGACLMVAPDMETIDVVIKMKHKNGAVLDDYKFTAKASEVVLEEGGNKVDVTAFEAGKSYNFIVNVYGPEEIKVTAELADWLPGGDFEFDPDDYFPPVNDDNDDNDGDDEEEEDDVVVELPDFDDLPEGKEPTINVEPTGGELDIQIRTNQEYNVQIPDDAKDWIDHVETKALNDGVIKLIIKANSTSTSRSATISIVVGSVVKVTITITQEASGDNEDETVSVESVSLDKTSATISEGETFALTATVTPDNATNKAVTWTSSNEAVATVADGVVTAVGAGTATITVTTEDGGKTATCTVTVNAKVYPVTSVTLNQTSATLTEGETLTLSATVNPETATNKNVTWSTSDPSVATVDNGVVTAIKAGTATITVTTEDGGKTATCTVTVNAKQNEGNENVATNPGNGQFQ